MKSIEPKIKQVIAENNKKGANVGDIFLFDITSTVRSKFIILLGIASVSYTHLRAHET